jgi:hypothetical protein
VVSGHAPAVTTTVGSPYSLSSLAHFTIPGSTENLTTFSFGGATNLTATFPGPSGLALVLAGLPVLGAAWLRRRVG